jgi:hypothetical protein
VLIAMGIDTDDVIQFVCKHPDRSSVRRVGNAGLEQGTAWQVCDESRAWGART